MGIIKELYTYLPRWKSKILIKAKSWFSTWKPLCFLGWVNSFRVGWVDFYRYQNFKSHLSNMYIFFMGKNWWINEKTKQTVWKSWKGDFLRYIFSLVLKCFRIDKLWVTWHLSSRAPPLQCWNMWTSQLGFIPQGWKIWHKSPWPATWNT